MAAPFTFRGEAAGSSLHSKIILMTFLFWRVVVDC